jgi:hypothetical protein
MRNAVIPAVNFTAAFVPKESKHIFGAGIDYKTIVPEIQTTTGYKTNTSLSSISATVFSKLNSANSHGTTGFICSECF